MKTPPLLPLVFSLCWTLVSAQFPKNPEHDFENSPQIPIILSIACLSIWTHTFFSKYNLIPLKLVYLLYTVFAISVSQKLWNIFGEESNKVMFKNPYLISVIYFPLMVSKMCFSYDKYLFFSTLPSVIFISTVVSAVNLAMHTAFLKLTFFVNWTWLKCSILAVVFSTTQSAFISQLLNDHKYQKLKAKMHGEALVYVGFALVYFDIGVGMFWGYELEGYGYWILLFFYKIVVGLLTGYLLAIFTTFAIKLCSNAPDMCAVIVLCMLITCYVVVESIAASPFFGMLAMGIVLMQYRDHMMEDNVLKIREFFELLFYIANFGTYAFLIFVIFSWWILDGVFATKNAIVNYLVILLSRFCTFCVAYPVLKWLTPTFNCTYLFMMIWAKVISNTSLIMTMFLLYTDSTHEFAREILNLILIITLITQSINSITFIYFVKKRFLKRKTLNQITNILNTLKNIYHQRDSYISMWKMKGLMVDVRWDVINDLTDIKQPFKKDDKGPIDDHILKFAPRKATCPDCKRVVMAELSSKDKTDMKIEATRRILKEMHMHLVKIYSMGLISVECSLAARKMIDDSDSIFINISEIQSYFRPNHFLDATKRLYGRIFKFDVKSVKIPRKPFRRICYKIIMNRYYHGIIYCVNYVFIYPLIVFILAREYKIIFITAIVINYVCMLILFFNMIITIFAYSFIYLRDGLKTYFSSYWHVLDCCIVLLAIMEILVNSALLVLDVNLENNAKLYYINLIRLVIIFKMFEGQIPKFLKLFDEIIDVRVSFGFELVQAFRACYDEVLVILNKIIVNNYDLEMECRESLEKARWAILELMLQIQLEKPWVAIGVKTRHVMNAAVKAMYGTISDQKNSGFLDSYEYESLKNNIKAVEMRRTVLNKKLQICDDEIISGISWMSSDKEAFEFIRDSAAVVYFNPDTIICNEDDYLNGIYIIIKGLLKLEYSPRVSTMDQLLNKGRLPVMDFIDSNIFDRYRYELIFPGNSIGELCYLLDRPYDAKITAICHVKAFYLSENTITELMDRNSDMLDGLGARMWKSAIYHMSLWILRSASVFDDFTKKELKQKLERAFVPNLQGYRTLYLNEHIEDLILIDGQISNLLIKEVYNAPCYIPRTVTSFSISGDEDNYMNIVILIIPMPEASIASLMTSLVDDSDVTESDNHLKKRASGHAQYKSIDVKLNKNQYAYSSVFNPLEMLKQYRKSV